MTILAALISIWGIFNVYFFFKSLIMVRKNKLGCDFTYWWSFLTGAFVWEDLFVFSIFHMASVAITLYFRDLKIWVVMYSVFWIVRAAGEVLYFFLQQFIEPKHHPHYINGMFTPIRSIFGDISEQKCFIIMQVSLQVVLMTASLTLIAVFVNWNSINLPI